MSRGRVLYLPVETKARELLRKKLPGRARRGARLDGGDRDRDWKSVGTCATALQGVFAVASVAESKAERLQEMRKAGHQVANLCEESYGVLERPLLL